MPPDKVYKTVQQYNKKAVSEADMEKLREIASDYSKVKNYVYARYGGISGLGKLYPGYTVQNEMTDCGLRAQLGLPSVYFYLAIFDALGDIKSQWTRTKTKILSLLGRTESFTEQEKHYIRFLLKVNNAFEAVLNQRPVEGLPEKIQMQYRELSETVDVGRMHRYLCRQVRKYHVKLHSQEETGFSIAERAYRYGDHGIYISTKEKRQRIFIELTDNNQYQSQLYIKLFPEDRRIEIKAPIQVTVCSHADYKNQTGIAMGIHRMLTTDDGHIYGEDLGKYQIEYAQWMRIQTGIYHRNREENPGRKKYNAKKRRLEEQLHSYINRELNRFFREEKPCTVYMVKLPKAKGNSNNKRVNHFLSRWQRGYIRRRLEQKCREQAITLVEVLGKDISRECNSCGEIGEKNEGMFHCPFCGLDMEEKTNTAKNILRRGLDGRVVR